MDELSGPRQIGDMNETFDSFFELDEGPEIRQAADLPFDLLPGLVFFPDSGPGIGRKLLDPEGDFFIPFVEIEDDDIDFLPNGEDFRGVPDLPPGHVRNVKEAERWHFPKSDSGVFPFMEKRWRSVNVRTFKVGND